jgi:phage repressor protein C with HTH and peptisase S24 domain
MKERLIAFLAYIRIGQVKFEERVGLSRGFINKIGDSIREKNKEKILRVHPELNWDWVLTGNGEMLRYNMQDNTEVEPKKVHKAYSVPDSFGLGIPLIPIGAMAGFGTGETQVMEYECERYVIPAFKDAEFLIQVKGSSMYPKYSSGDIVACRKLPVDTFFQWSKVYVLDTVQGALIKRVKRGKDNNYLLMVSENEKYEPFELPRSEINSVALVVGVIRLE